MIPASATLLALDATRDPIPPHLRPAVEAVEATVRQVARDLADRLDGPDLAAAYLLLSGRLGLALAPLAIVAVVQEST